MIKKIVSTTEDVRKNIEETLPYINDEIQNIISSKNKDEHRVEKLLDTLLDYCYLGMGKDEFNKLNNYYFSFNSKNSKEYEKFYEEI